MKWTNNERLFLTHLPPEDRFVMWGSLIVAFWCIYQGQVADASKVLLLGMCASYLGKMVKEL